MLFEKGVNGGRKELIAGRRGNALPPGQLGPDPGPVGVPVQIRGQRARFTAFLVPDAPCLALVHDGHEGADAVETARKTGIRIQLHQDFLDLIDGQTGFQTGVQGGLQLFHVAVGGEGRDGHNAPLPGVQRVSFVHGARLRKRDGQRQCATDGAEHKQCFHTFLPLPELHPLQSGYPPDGQT